MPALELGPNFSDADRFYAALTELHRDVSEQDSERINARLILLLANHIGDQDVLDEALRLARRAAPARCLFILSGGFSDDPTSRPDAA